MIARFHSSQCFATVDPANEPFVPKPGPELQRQLLRAEIVGAIARVSGQGERAGETARLAADAAETAASAQAASQAREPRSFRACVCCAMQQWSENLNSEFLVGDKCTIKNRAQFADCLSADWYHRRWPLIPREELMSSAVDFPHEGSDGSPTCTKILLHKRRVPPEALEGAVPVLVCDDCRRDLWSDCPRVPLMALVNDLWLGRHHPLIRKAALAHQMLLALGRVVSTKVYLSSKGADKAVRQERQSWRQKFLQSAMQGTAIVFGNGNVDHAMRSFPPEDDMLRDTFVAVFAGPDDDEEGCPLTEEQKLDRALKAMREEVALRVDKVEFDKQARFLKRHNYVYNGPAVQYRADLVDRFPSQADVPECMLACAKYIPTEPTLDDVTQAQGPASATTGAQAEIDATVEDAQELCNWMSVVEESLDDVSELTSIPAAQGMIERMTTQAGRVVANELMTRLEGKAGEDGKLLLDDIGRQSLQKLCQEFHGLCRKLSHGEDVAKLHWRIQALLENDCLAKPPDEDDARSAQEPAGPDGRREARLRVPTTRRAESFWNPKYWSIARPTDFPYGDCAWGIGHFPPSPTADPQIEKEARLCFGVADFIKNLLTREEMEYDVEGDQEMYGEKYAAAPISRFRSSWYDLHLLHSFWRVTETTNSVYTFMKQPGAFGAARACADLTPEMIAAVQLRAQQSNGKTTLHGILKDKDTPNEVRKAFATLGQATASLVGSDGHRRELRGEGEAYTLRFGPPVQFVTPNLADTKQPLILIVQGETLSFDNALNALTGAEQVTFSQMSQRVAGDPVAQAVVFELMMRLFFVHVLGLRAETVGWRRGAIRKSSRHWVSDGVAADLMGVPTVFGPIAAAFGPVEAQGRGSLHPHILIWLLQAQLPALLDMLQRDKACFQERLNRMMRQVAEAVVATQQSAVGLFPLQLQNGENRCGVEMPPLPFGPNEKRNFRADGAREVATAEQLGGDGVTGNQPLDFHEPAGDQYHAAYRPNLPLRDDAGEVVADEATYVEQKRNESKGYWKRPLSSSVSGIFPEYRSGGTLAEALPSVKWIRAICKDLRELIIGSGIHVCSPSCYKYHSDQKRGKQICRHNFYNVVTLCTWDEESGESEECRLRSRGKALRGCVGIFRETDYGMAGRIVTFQLHPGETSTHYAAVVAARCNVDVQDMRRVLPPRLWMAESDLEPEAQEEDRKSYNHGCYPQRYPDLSVGDMENWGWYRHLNTTPEKKWDLVIVTDWHEIHRELAGRDASAAGGDEPAGALPRPELEQHAVATFVDAHNTSYYVNSYTTKVNPRMDDVLKKLLDGVRRLKHQWGDGGAQAAGDAGDGARSAASEKRREAFKRTMQVLSRFETCFRRAAWKSGCEMVFPMLFGHLAFMTHRCWKVFMRKSIYLAAESWRRRYGQAATAESVPAASVTYTLPSTGEHIAMPGWSEVHVGPDGVRSSEKTSETETVFVSPEGEEFNALEYAHEAFKIAKATGGSLRDVTRALKKMQEGEAEEEPDDAGPTVDDLAQKKSKGAVLSQHDDWMHRGDHPIVRDMSLYIYSIWVYRVELPRHALPAGELEPEGSGGRTLNVDIPFDSSYSAARNYTQRLAAEPRIPKPDGYQFVSEDSNAETHYLMKSVLLKPVRLPVADGANDTKELRYLRAYEHLCAAPEGEPQWPAQPAGEGAPGPFQRGWESFATAQEQLARAARAKCLRNDVGPWATPSIWNTEEVETALRMKRTDRREDVQPPCRCAQCQELGNWLGNMLTVEEYMALETTKTAANFEGISKAKASKPRRQQKDDVEVAEAPVCREGAEDSGAGAAQMEAASINAREGLAKLGANVCLEHEFDPETLAQILKFDTAERTTSFIKELKQANLIMETGELPAPREGDAPRRAIQNLKDDILRPYEALRALDASELRAVVEAQRKMFAKGGTKDAHVPADDDAPAHDDAAGAAAGSGPAEAAQARWVESPEMPRPSDFVKALVRKFEEGVRNPITGQQERRPLKPDQALFAAAFAKACNEVWDEEQKILGGEMARQGKRKTFQFLLLGQGGSGKTAIVQEIVLPAMDALFPPEIGETKKSTLIVCAKWSQAANISTDAHKAVSCHRAGVIGAQSFRSKDMLAGGKLKALRETWEPLRCLILEEVSMIPPNMYHMLTFRAHLGRQDKWGAEERECDMVGGAFGRIPIVIHLGDFLQLKPTGGRVSLISSFEDLAAAGINLAPEYQAAMKLFCNTPKCFELQASNRFKDPRLRELMDFIRKPGKQVPPAIRATWNAVQLKEGDPRLREDRFQNGHMIGSYWDTVSRWMHMRARRDAKSLGQPLFIVQAADRSAPKMDRKLAAKMMNCANPKNTGGMHGLLLVHVGMRIRLLEALDLQSGLVKDTEGQIVRVVVDPRDRGAADAAERDGRGHVYLKHLPLGFWVRMEKYAGAPFKEDLGRRDDSLTGELTGPLVFIEPRTSEPFTFRGSTVVRTGFPFSHGRVITTVACQGRTMREGDGAGERRSGDGQTSGARAVRSHPSVLWTLALGRRLPGALLPRPTSPRRDPGLRPPRGRERQEGGRRLVAGALRAALARHAPRGPPAHAGAAHRVLPGRAAGRLTETAGAVCDAHEAVQEGRDGPRQGAGLHRIPPRGLT